jgi:DNA-binding NarL/FixJ family response regulator
VTAGKPSSWCVSMRRPSPCLISGCRSWTGCKPPGRSFDADEYIYEALRAGASGFLLKDAPADQLITAVRSLAAGDALIDPAITRRLISRFALAARGPAGRQGELRQLTARELEVLRLVARGLSNIEIARELVVEENTVKTHVSRILVKLGPRDRVQAVVLAYEVGFVTPEARG